jgi:hypothetical protein
MFIDREGDIIKGVKWKLTDKAGGVFGSAFFNLVFILSKVHNFQHKLQFSISK